ncbi:copper resistance CopC family protein [Cellulomonas sp. URHB0016]
MTRPLRVAAVLLLWGAALLAGATGAQAHDALVGTNPADGSSVEVPPHHVTLTFSSPAVALGTEVVVTGPDGTVASTGPAELVDDDVNQYLLERLPKGVYTVQWRVTSEDGHPVTGTFSFTAENAIGLPPDATAVPEAGDPPAGTQATDAADAAATAAATATPTGGLTPAAVAAPSPDDQAVSPGVLVGVGAVLLVAGGIVAWLLLRRPAVDALDAADAGAGSAGRAPGPDDLP